jgi:hypothetical protein
VLFEILASSPTPALYVKSSSFRDGVTNLSPPPTNCALISLLLEAKSFATAKLTCGRIRALSSSILLVAFIPISAVFLSCEYLSIFKASF